MKDLLVSVIVTTRDSAKTIDRCLHSIQSQAYPHIEIILIDNHSKDKTISIAKKYTKHIYIEGPERSSQRNMGAKKAKGEYLLFLDSDMYLSEKVVEECVEKLQHNYIALYIPEKILGTSWFSKVRDFERSFYNQTVIDAVRFISKKNFVASGGFDEDLIAGEDWDFDKKVRALGKTDIIESPLYHDESHLNIQKHVSKKEFYGSLLDKYIQKWGPDDTDVVKQFGLYYRYFGVFVELGKWKKIISHPFLFTSLFFIKGLVGFKYLLSKMR